MNTDQNRETAKILAFPTGGRSGLPAARKVRAANELERPAPSTVISDSWYHDAAIREAEKSH